MMNLEQYIASGDRNIFWELEPGVIQNILEEAILERNNFKTALRRTVRHIKNESMYDELVDDIKDLVGDR